jgi:hypothetical protein
VLGAVPLDWRRGTVERADLPQFLFAEDDLVVVVGQDGLVANVAKYLDGQLVVGLNPSPAEYDGVLCRHRPAGLGPILSWLERPSARGYRVERRTMAVVEREDGQRLLALNEVFIGHRTHQSARYRLRCDEYEERQSSSGLICSTGTGATGWALSIARQRGLEALLPGPEEALLAWFVREPFPSVATGTKLDHGALEPGKELEIVSEMGVGGVIFADGIEVDHLELLQGESARVRLAERGLSLVVPGA